VKINFEKYQGTGNDFIMIDNRDGQFDHDIKKIQNICDRRFGVGGDGLITIEDHADYDFEMIYYNSDGSQSLCGNGARCAVSFAHSLGLFDDETDFMAFDGPHKAVLEDGLVRLKMNDVEDVEVGDDYFFLDTGSPHYVKFVKNVDEVNVVEEGRAIRNNERYREAGTNVNFVEVEPDKLKVRTYERGVEDETFSCGTGVTAVVLSAGVKGIVQEVIGVNVKGGRLEVSFKKQPGNKFSDIWLKGPGEKVFEGEFEI